MDSIHQHYRQRFGIETSYRLKNFCRIRTTTKNPMIRLLYLGISFLLVNIWIYIFWSKISKPRRGGRARLSSFVDPIPTYSALIIVPRSPLKIAAASSNLPIPAMFPVASTKQQTASTFGCIEPGAKL